MKAVIKHQQQWGIAELLPLKKYENGIYQLGLMTFWSNSCSCYF